LPLNPKRFGLAWLSGLGAWLMSVLNIDLKKYIVKKEEDKTSIKGITNS
jgi:hypothetical protein